MRPSGWAAGVAGMRRRGGTVLFACFVAASTVLSILVTSGGSSTGPFTYATYIGGAVEDVVEGIAIDAQGSAYLAGWTTSPDFPATPGAFDTSANGEEDAFVAKLSPDGSQLLYATFLGGSSYDHASGIAVDASGNAYVTGYTQSPEFPTTAGALNRTYPGERTAFGVKLDPSGSALSYSTLLGGTAGGGGGAIAIDAAGHAYVCGYEECPVVPGSCWGFPTNR